MLELLGPIRFGEIWLRNPFKVAWELSFTQESAETVSLQAMAWLAGNDELLPVFLGASGASEADFRNGLGDPVFQGAVLDFVMMDDAWVMAFCESAGLDYTVVAQARAALPGGGEWHWT